MRQANTQHQVGPLIICPTGDLDFSSAGSFRDAIVDGLKANTKGLIVSLEDVPFMDSSALGVLVGAWKRSRELDAPFHVVCPREHIYKTFRITGLDKVIHLHASVPDALEAVASGQSWEVQR